METLEHFLITAPLSLLRLKNVNFYWMRQAAALAIFFRIHIRERSQLIYFEWLLVSNLWWFMINMWCICEFSMFLSKVIALTSSQRRFPFQRRTINNFFLLAVSSSSFGRQRNETKIVEELVSWRMENAREAIKLMIATWCQRRCS